MWGGSDPQCACPSSLEGGPLPCTAGTHAHQQRLCLALNALTDEGKRRCVHACTSVMLDWMVQLLAGVERDVRFGENKRNKPGIPFNYHVYAGVARVCEYGCACEAAKAHSASKSRGTRGQSPAAVGRNVCSRTSDTSPQSARSSLSARPRTGFQPPALHTGMSV